jgi:diamine N-acetyltransferase
MLHAKQIYIRGVEREDLVLRPRWFNDPEVNRTLMIDVPVSYAQTESWFNRSLQDETKLNFSICFAATHQVIGMTGFLAIDKTHRRAQFYMTIGEKDYWGRRIPDEVIPLMLSYGFTELYLNKIYLYTIPFNVRARKVYERNGFTQEAVMREHHYCRGGSQDLIQHGVVKSDWLATRRCGNDRQGKLGLQQP